MTYSLEQELSAGKNNSLGNTIAVVEHVRKEPALLPELFACYDSSNEWVRLRTSNAFKRIFRLLPEHFPNYADAFILLMGRLQQPSAQWTFCDICREHTAALSAVQLKRAKAIILRMLHDSHDWIVLNASIKTLALWSTADATLRAALLPRLAALQNEPRKSVATNAQKAWNMLHNARNT